MADTQITIFGEKQQKMVGRWVFKIGFNFSLCFLEKY